MTENFNIDKSYKMELEKWINVLHFDDLYLTIKPHLPQKDDTKTYLKEDIKNKLTEGSIKITLRNFEIAM